MKLIYGFHALTRYLRLFPHQVQEVYVSQERSDPRMRDLLKLIESQRRQAIRVDPHRLCQLAGSPKHQGVVAFVRVEANNLALDDVLATISEPPLLLVLDGITDPHNLGACLRVADAMGVHAVIAPKDRSVGMNATVSKVACGAAELIPYFAVSNLARMLRKLKEMGIWIIGTDAEGHDSLYAFEQTGPLAWVLGAEGDGLRRLTREHCDTLVSIPMFGHVESLNVSVATGIVLAETRRQRLQ